MPKTFKEMLKELEDMPCEPDPEFEKRMREQFRRDFGITDDMTEEEIKTIAARKLWVT